MNKPILVVTLLLGGLGCLGADPNMNSQIFGDAAPPTTGTAGTGGSGAGGTSGGTASGPIKGTPIATFMSTLDGFQLNPYHDTGSKNLADPMSGASPAPTFSVDMNEGSPDPGSFKVTATYSAANQYVDVQKNMMTTPGNWAGRTLHVRVKVASGNFMGGAQVYVLTDPFIFGGTYTNIASNHNWQEFTVNLDSPMHPDPGYDPSKVTVIGVQLTSGAMNAPGEVVFNVDSFSVDPPLAGAGGTGGTGGGGGTAGTGGGSGGSGGAGGSGDASVGN
jgi:hypothetical protein